MEILVIFFFLTIVIIIFQSLTPELSQPEANTHLRQNTAHGLNNIYSGSDDTQPNHHYLFY